MKRKNAPRVHFSLLVLCYLEVVLWTACLLTSSTTLPSEALAGQGYLQRETGNLKNLIHVGRASAATPRGASPGNPFSGAGSDVGSCAAHPPSSSSPSSSAAAAAAASSSSFAALGGGWPLYARQLLAGERHFQLERLYLRQVLASWAALGFLPASLVSAARGGSGGGPLRPTPDATGLPAPFAGIKAID